MIQLLVVAVVLAAAIFYAGYRICRLIRKAGDPCYGCEGCDLHRAMAAKRQCEKKK